MPATRLPPSPAPRPPGGERAIPPSLALLIFVACLLAANLATTLFRAGSDGTEDAPPPERPVLDQPALGSDGDTALTGRAAGG